MKNLVRVEIWGREYTLRSDEGEERVQKIAEYVNQKIKEVLNTTKTVSTLNIAMLAALNMANDYFELVEIQNRLNREIEKKSGRLIAMIDSKMS